MEKVDECPITNILFVDGDNMLESAVLEALTQYYADVRGVDISVLSVGAHAKEGEHRYKKAYKFRFDTDYIRLPTEKYYQILRGATRRMTPERLENADLIVLLSSRYEADVKAMLPETQWHKIALFHLYCFGNRSRAFPEHALHKYNHNLIHDFYSACSHLITRISAYSYYERIIQYNLEGLRQSFIQQYQQQLVDGFTDKEVMVNTNHCKLFVDGDIWLRLQRWGVSYALDIVFKNEHNSSSLTLVGGSLDDIRQALYSETFARDHAMAYDHCEQSYERLLSDPR
jgi:protein-tyrosine-phosphatase